MTISDILYLIAACFGLAVIANQWSEVFLVVRILGAGYLFYLGWKMWTAPVNLKAEQKQSNAAGHVLSFIQGFLISASNPKVILFYIAFLPTFMDLTVLSAPDIALASVLTLVSLMLGLSAIAWFASAARRFFESERGAKSINRGAGAIMISAGAFLLGKS
jgi:threonine/homoserine/homoserine lactone efflux protein